MLAATHSNNTEVCQVKTLMFCLHPKPASPKSFTIADSWYSS